MVSHVFSLCALPLRVVAALGCGLHAMAYMLPIGFVEWRAVCAVRGLPATVGFSDLAARKQQANLNLKPHACRKQASMQQAGCWLA